MNYKFKLLNIAFCVIALLLLPVVGIAQQTSVPPTKTPLRTMREFQEQQLLNFPRIIMGGPIDPDTYRMGPGDEMLVTIGGISPEPTLPLIVLPEGVMNIPDAGIADLNGLTLTESRKLIIGMLQKLYPESKISVTLTNLRVFIVRLTGEIVETGIRYATATGRVSDVLDQSGGLTNWANIREIEIRRADGSVEKFDAWKYYNFGGLENNPLLSDGDEVFVPGSNFTQGSVFVRGPSAFTGFHQYYPGESVFEFLKREEIQPIGLNLDKINILRNAGSAGSESIELSLDEDNLSVLDFILRSGDVLVLPVLETFVYVDGEVANPGAIPWIADRKARYYIGIAGRTSDAAGENKVIVTRSGENEFIIGQNPVIFTGDQIHVPKKKYLIVKDWLEFLSPIVSLILAGKAIGIF